MRKLSSRYLRWQRHVPNHGGAPDRAHARREPSSGDAVVRHSCWRWITTSAQLLVGGTRAC